MAQNGKQVKKVLFATKCYEKDYHKFLSGAFERKLESCCYPFTDQWLMLNNGVPDDVEFTPKTVNVLEHQADALDFFDLTRDDFKASQGNGYWYSIAELVTIYLAEEFDYLCWVQGDCLISPSKDWISEGIQILESDQSISIVSPGSEVNTYGEIDQECSDQAFLIRVSEFRKPIYSWIEPEQPNYPSYGGESFEFKVGQYLKNNGKGRRILFESNLLHPQY